MTNNTKEAQQILDELHQADVAYRNARATELRRAQQEAEKKILAQKVNRDKLAAQARDAGNSWQKISAAMGTSATKTAKEAAMEGWALMPAENVAIAFDNSDRFDWDGSTLHVSLAPIDVAPILEFTPYTLEDVNADPELLRASFSWNGDGWEAEKAVHPVTSLFFSPVYTELMAQASGFVEGSAA